MSSQSPAPPHQAQVVDLDQFEEAEFVADLETAYAVTPPPCPVPSGQHPERASTACGCRSPEPCYEHALDTGRDLAELEGYAPYPAPPGTVPSACTCPDPDGCSCGGQGRRPHYRPAPAWNEPKPDSPVGRTLRRLQRDRELGVLPGAEPGQGTAVLPYLTDHELGAWTQALLAEHHRRQSRFADYRRGAQAAGA